MEMHGEKPIDESTKWRGVEMTFASMLSAHDEA